MQYTNKEHLILNYRLKFSKFIKKMAHNEDINNLEFPILLSARFNYVMHKIFYANKDFIISSLQQEEEFKILREEINQGIYDKYLLPNYYIEEI